jgi:hypothetical protein
MQKLDPMQVIPGLFERTNSVPQELIDRVVEERKLAEQFETEEEVADAAIAFMNTWAEMKDAKTGKTLLLEHASKILSKADTEALLGLMNERLATQRGDSGY